MALLSELPTEIILIIFSYLKPFENPENQHHLRVASQELFLPFSQTNKLLWSIARPLVYHELEITVKPEAFRATDSPKFFNLHLRTFLLCRTLQEHPTLASYTKTLSLQGMLDPSRDGPTKRIDVSSLTYTTSDLAKVLVSFTKTRTFFVHGAIRGNINRSVNQILLSCIKSMTMLEELHLYAYFETSAEVIIHFLNAASSKLEYLAFRPFDESIADDFTPPLDNGLTPTPTPRSNLRLLCLSTNVFSLVEYIPWLSTLVHLELNQILLSDGRTRQGFTIQSLLAPVASTLEHLILDYDYYTDVPSLSDFDMSQCVKLKVFSYSGPWWIKPDDSPMDICQTLLSKSYSTLNIRQVSTYDRITRRSVRVFTQAFTLAHLHNFSLENFNLVLDLDDLDAKHVDNIVYEAHCLIKKLHKRGTKALLELSLPV
jgi:hypothetical protein